MKYVRESDGTPVIIPARVSTGLLPLEVMHKVLDTLCKGTGLHVHSFTYGCKGLTVECLQPEGMTAEQVQSSVFTALKPVIPVDDRTPLRVQSLLQAVAQDAAADAAEQE